MSAILATHGMGIPSEAYLRQRLGAMSRRGREISAIWRSEEAALAVARDRWEMQPGFAGETMLGERPGVRVVCDATLYYITDLQEELTRAGVAPRSESAADLIAAAYEAFGRDCVDHLEGDYAFCIWDSRDRSLFCARDPFGARSLFYRSGRSGVTVASTVHPLVTRGSAAEMFDPVGVLRSVLLRSGDGSQTAWRDVRELPAGHRLVSRADAGLEIDRYWIPGARAAGEIPRGQEAADRLRGLLEAAVRQRNIDGMTSLAMSGGQDSTAILATMPEQGVPPLQILSFRLPEGDPGNEAWYIDQVAEHFRTEVVWVETAHLGLYEGLESRATLRSQCHGHIFEGHNRALASTAAEAGHRVLLNGHGGDNVLAVGDLPMADLLRSGRFLQLHRYRSQRGYRGVRLFLDRALRPALPLGVFDAAEFFLRRRICSRPFERPLPEWVDPDSSLLAEISKADREDHEEQVIRRYRKVTQRLRAWAVSYSGFSRSCAASFDLNRDEGVELRMPFYDRRLIEFVLSLPTDELEVPNEHKALLRRAMRGRLPERKWLPQPGGLKPGTAVGVVRARYNEETSALIGRLREGEWISDALGVVDSNAFFRQIEGEGKINVWTSVDISSTLFAEVWLRANLAEVMHRGVTNVA